MAIEPVMADVIRKLAPGLPNRRALCLGYPEILTTATDWAMDIERLQIARWHNWNGGIERAEDFFAALDLEPEYWDVTKARGPERIVDLNALSVVGEGPDAEAWMPGPQCVAMANEFAIVIDPGTIEHIANIGNCWRTLTAVTAVGGAVVHCNPFGWANHGMYAISPTCYIDIYEANGFEIEMLAELSGPLDNRTMRDAKTTARFNASPNAVMLCVARKVQDVAFQFPVQSKYRANPTLKAAQ